MSNKEVVFGHQRQVSLCYARQAHLELYNFPVHWQTQSNTDANECTLRSSYVKLFINARKNLQCISKPQSLANCLLWSWSPQDKLFGNFIVVYQLPQSCLHTTSSTGRSRVILFQGGTTGFILYNLYLPASFSISGPSRRVLFISFVSVNYIIFPPS